MKLWEPQRRLRWQSIPTAEGGGNMAEGSGGGGVSLKSPVEVFWIGLHAFCCLFSLVLGFRFSRLLFFLLFSPVITDNRVTTPSPILRTTTTTLMKTTTTITSTTTTTKTMAAPVDLNSTAASRVVVGRHGILIRPWPHPNPTEVMRAHRIIERVQQEQRAQFIGVRSPRAVIAITPTYSRTFQVLHLTGLAHTLRLVPYVLTWIVVEACGAGGTDETKAFLARSGISRVLHIPLQEKIPAGWDDRHLMESRMRLHALRIVRERSLEGIIVFTDESNMHTMEFFDEIQSVKWIGALSVGILAHSRVAEPQEDKEAIPLPIQGPACNSSNQLAGWHTFNSVPYAKNAAKYVGEGSTVLPRKLEWAGFAISSKLVLKEAVDKPVWVRDLDAIGENGEDVGSPLSLLHDPSFVEPLGNCGKKVLVWWLRVEAHGGSKFPPGWKIDPPPEIIFPAKRTPWPESLPKLPSERLSEADKSPPRTGKSSKPKRSSRNKKKHDSPISGTASNAR